MKRANRVGHLRKTAGSGAGSGGFRGLFFRLKSCLVEAPLHFFAGSAAGSGGFRGALGGLSEPKQTHGLKHFDQKQRVPGRIRWVPAGSRGSDRLWLAGFRRVLAGSAAGARLVHPDRNQRAQEQASASSGGFQWGRQVPAGSGGFRWTWRQRWRRQVPAGSSRSRWVCVHRQGAEEGTWRETSRLKPAVSRAGFVDPSLEVNCFGDWPVA